MDAALKQAVDSLNEVERLELLDYLREGNADAAFDLGPTEKEILRDRYRQLCADPSAPTFTIEEIAAELGVRL